MRRAPAVSRSGTHASEAAPFSTRRRSCESLFACIAVLDRGALGQWPIAREWQCRTAPRSGVGSARRPGYGLAHVMKIRRFPVSFRMSAAALACLSGALLTACSAGEGDDPESESNAAFGPRNNSGAAGNGSAPVGNAPSVGAPGAAGSPSTAPAPTGNNNGEMPNGNVSNVAPPQQMMGGGNQNGMQNNGAAGSAGMQNGGAAGSGQMPPNPPPATDGVGRVGVEQCPAGPFGEPVPANPVVTKLVSVGADNNFNFEGPVWVGDALYFSEIGNAQNPPPSNINRYRPGGMLERGVIQNTGSNGLAIDAQGNLLAATHDVGAISTFTLAGV